MEENMKLKRIMAMFLVGAMTVGTLAGCSSGSSTTGSQTAAAGNSETTGTSGEAKEFEGVTITFFKDTDFADEGINAVIALAEEKYGMNVEIEQRVGGADGDNIVKTRLASGDMADIMLYNSGSLLNALNPAEYFYGLNNEDFIQTYDETYQETVTVDGVTYGIPAASTQAGAFLYYKPDYEALGLEVPKTWAEFLSNCEQLKAAGRTAVIGTFGDSWTSQVIFLGDHYNILAAEPDFAREFEAGTTKYANTDAGVKSFQKLLDVRPYYNEDYLAATYDDGCDMIANGEGTHWAILTQALSNIYALYPEAMENIGVFGVPGEDADDAGLTVWMPSSYYINKNSENLDAVLAFMKLYISEEGLDAYAQVLKPDGPYCIQGYNLPADAYPAVKDDMQRFFDDEKTSVAIEFQTSVKGSNCPAICQEAGSGQTTAGQAASAYDEDCKKQAVQLGLDW